MARKVFFSFHFKNDVWRANQVRNSWVTQGTEVAGFIDSADFEKIKQKGEDEVKKWIDNQLKNTSVTVVLIGSETSNRDYVQYELQRSYQKGNAIIGVYIHNLKDKIGKVSEKGKIKFGPLGKYSNGDLVFFFQIARTYDYVLGNGYENLGKWIEEAAKERGK